MTGVIWTSEEDEMLKHLVAEHGTKKWSFIATKIKTKGSKQCRRRWKNFLNMNAKTCSWSQEEDEQLVQLHQQYGNKWTEISRVFGDRTDNAVKNRWAALVRKNPRLGEDDGQGQFVQETPSAKRQRLGNASPVALYQPYMSPHGQHPSVVGQLNGEAFTNMPTPFDQELLRNLPVQQRQQQPQQYFEPALYGHQQQQQAAMHNTSQPADAAPLLSILVNKDILNPQEIDLVQQINETQAPVHIEVQERPNTMDDTAELVAKRSSWRQFLEGLDEPKNTMNDILAWFGTSNSLNQLPGNLGRRLTRSLSKYMTSGAESLADEHRSLLVRLMSKGLEYRTSSEQAELDLMGLATAALSEGAELGLSPPEDAAAAAPPSQAGPRRADPILRTRSSQRGPGSQDGTPAGEGAADAIHLHPSDVPSAQQPAPPPGGGLISRRSSQRFQQQQQSSELLPQCSIPYSLPSLGDAYGDVLLTPTFTSAEIAMLIEALTPAGGDSPQ